MALDNALYNRQAYSGAFKLITLDQSAIKTVVVGILNSNLDKANLPGNVLLEQGQGGVKKASVVNITQIFTVDKNDLGEHIGSITQQKMKQIISGINVLLQPMEIIQE